MWWNAVFIISIFCFGPSNTSYYTEIARLHLIVNSSASHSRNLLFWENINTGTRHHNGNMSLGCVDCSFTCIHRDSSRITGLPLDHQYRVTTVTLHRGCITSSTQLTVILRSPQRTDPFARSNMLSYVPVSFSCVLTDPLIRLDQFR